MILDEAVERWLDRVAWIAESLHGGVATAIYKRTARAMYGRFFDENTSAWSAASQVVRVNRLFVTYSGKPDTNPLDIAENIERLMASDNLWFAAVALSDLLQ